MWEVMVSNSLPARQWKTGSFLEMDEELLGDSGAGVLQGRCVDLMFAVFLQIKFKGILKMTLEVGDVRSCVSSALISSPLQYKSLCNTFSTDAGSSQMASCTVFRVTCVQTYTDSECQNDDTKI